MLSHVFGLYIVERDYTHWRIQESVFWGSVFQGDPSQVTPKTKNSTDLGHFLVEGPEFTFALARNQIYNVIVLLPNMHSSLVNRFWKHKRRQNNH